MQERLNGRYKLVMEDKRMTDGQKTLTFTVSYKTDENILFLNRGVIEA